MPAANQLHPGVTRSSHVKGSVFGVKSRDLKSLCWPIRNAKGSMHVLWDGSALEEVLGECCAAPAGILGKGMQLATVANHCILDTGERS